MDDLELRAKWLKIGKSTYAEYKKHAESSIEWEALTEGQKSAFTAATYHMLVMMEQVGTSRPFIIDKSLKECP